MQEKIKPNDQVPEKNFILDPEGGASGRNAVMVFSRDAVEIAKKAAQKTGRTVDEVLTDWANQHPA